MTPRKFIQIQEVEYMFFFSKISLHSTHRVINHMSRQYLYVSKDEFARKLKVPWKGEIGKEK